ncbi:amino acid adenylation domain-containing protein [Pseudonocardia sp. DSM 110487]|uniref:Pls/PosA family non-ribosomal peptide synthetase n=1 Tax=Pseudonocardia sp. DSM 110487 TaxID=2865833 RepID=UPI001C6A57AB|nr:Pls/PosA family non-ribosomal peptide synthetase [Pseudonocardia sp. DSM 110487]QYN32894.1 amino acid adenylation domain-containing protein [Pseudonocardia sp. DSM 110487]
MSVVAAGQRAPMGVVLEYTELGRDVRWRPGERLEQLFEEQRDRMPEAHLAVDAADETLTYPQLDARANRMARYLLDIGVGPGDRVALLVDRAVQAYVGMLAVLKAGAAYVPLDPGFPRDRLSYIVTDAGVGVVLSVEHLLPHLGEVDADVVCLDTVAAEIEAYDDTRPPASEDRPKNDVAYVIYTSGSTGRPKGVAIEHASICNFVRVAAQVYGVRHDDRMYQGLTIAFDFSVEEIWVSWMVGATLVPRPSGPSLLGPELREFLTERRVTAMCCVPTLLATLDEDLPDLRFLLVSGEACPHDLIVRWHRNGRRFLNVYGPTETTVTATWTVADPDRAVTIGVPLPTYSIVVLDQDDPHHALPPGEVGEIGIAGIGLARGYLNRDDATANAFVPDFIGIPGNPSGRIYRTGDLGRVNADGEIEYLGRIDLQVKIRGYRIELTEIESVMLQVPGVAQAVVDTYEAVPGTVELVGYYSTRDDAGGLDPAEITGLLRDRLPAYMVPTYLEHLPVIPMTTSDKADRKRLPPPTTRTAVDEREHRAPTTGTEEAMADALARTLGTERVSVDSHFFDDLGANSLLMAQFATRVREETDLAPPAMKDIYLNPTLAKLAAVVGDGGARTVSTEEVDQAGTSRYVLCGALQVLAFLASTVVMSGVLVVGLELLTTANGFVDRWLRALAFTGTSFVVLTALPIAAKWLLVGRWKEADFPLWGLRYLRFWIVKLLVRANPMALFAGSPLYNAYLRALGARIGRNVVILSRNVPVCTDLLTIGDDTVVRKDTFFNGYRVDAGRVRTGSVTIGSDALVSEHAVLDIGSSMGDRTQLGHASSLQTGQAVPDGEPWHGSPAEPSDVDYRRVGPARCGRLRRFLFASAQLAGVLVYAPILPALLLPLITDLPLIARTWSDEVAAGTSAGFYLEALAYTAVLYVGGLVLGLALIMTVPRLLNLGLRPDTVYPLYGIRYWFQRALARATNSRFYTYLFGDSSAIVHYLRTLGYDVGKPLVQSGSNFGVEVRQESPFLSSVGRGTMVSDGLSMMNAEFSSTSFRVRRAALGERSFLGNNIAYPAGGRTGENCLLGTKVMVPLDGEVREGVGLLGSPSFEIPRTVERDHAFDHLETGEERRKRLRAKNRHNAATAGIFLLANFVNLYVVGLVSLFALDNFGRFGVLAVAAATFVSFVVSIAFFVLLERAVTAFRAMRPRFCSIYDPYFWWHERFWKMSAGAYLALFNGTPMKNLLWRALGVRIGHKVFDDGCAIPEKTLVTIGDHASLNAGSTIQAHSLEDGTFKSDYITIGPGCTLGTYAFAHYGVTMQEGSVLDADAFLMKGEDVPPRARYRGNPAREAAVS